MNIDPELTKLALDGGAIIAILLIVWKLGSIVESAQRAQASSFGVLKDYFVSEMKQSSTQIEDLKEELDRTKAKLDEKDRELQEVKAQLERVRSSERSKTKRIDTLEGDVDSLQSKLSAVTQERNALQARVEALEKQQSKTQAAIATTQEKPK